MDYLERIEQLEKKMAEFQTEISELKRELQKDAIEQPYISKTVGSMQEKEAETVMQTEVKKPKLSNVAEIQPKEEQGAFADAVKMPNLADVGVSGIKKEEPKSPVEKLSLEEKIGGKLMGIVAAVLVFIGLILFGTIVYEKLGDAARVVVLFLISSVILGVGIRLHRRKQSWFSLSLTGCGFGALYLSLFMTKVVFNLVSTEGLYGLLLFWFVGVGLFVWKYHSQVVSFLGLLGISMSVLFGVAFLEEESQYVFLVVYFFVLSSLYLWMILGRFLPQTKNEKYPKLFLVTMFAQMIQALALAAAFTEWYAETENTALGLLICLLFSVYVLVLPLLYHMRAHRQMGIPALFPTGIRPAPVAIGEKRIEEAEYHWIVFGWYQVLAGIMLALFWKELTLPATMQGNVFGYGLFALFFIGVWAVTEIFGITGIESIVASVITAVGLLMAGDEITEFAFNVFLNIFAVIFMLAGFFTRTRKMAGVRPVGNPEKERRANGGYGKLLEKLVSLVLLMIPFRMSADYIEPEGAFTGFAVCCMCLLALFFVFLLLGKKEEYKILYRQEYADGLKCACFVLFLIVVGYFCGWETKHFFQPTDDILSVTVMLTVVTVLNGIAFYGKLCKKIYEPDKEDKVMKWISFAVNQVLWIFWMFLLHDGATIKHPVCFVFILMATLYLCVSGMKQSYDAFSERTELGIYFGLRVTICVLVILTVFEKIPGFVISCVLILVALAAIIAGFKIKLKSLRLYGLVLTMLSVLKLLMLDISHDNSLQTVGCFLIAGILCFCINLVYNKVKKYVEEGTEQ